MAVGLALLSMCSLGGSITFAPWGVQPSSGTGSEAAGDAIPASSQQATRVREVDGRRRGGGYLRSMVKPAFSQAIMPPSRSHTLSYPRPRNAFAAIALILPLRQ